jgi:hypothetical protein
VIPKTFCYYWTGQRFQYVHYLAVLSLVKSTGCDRVDVHFEEQPRDNAHWSRLSRLERVRLVPIDFDRLVERAGFAPEHFRAFLQVAKTVHRSDFLRYLVLAGDGGIYLDFDTLVVRDMTPLLSRPFLVGYQNPDALGNDVNGAVLGAEPGAEVIHRCLEGVRAIPESLKPLRLGNLRYGLLRKFFVPYLHWCDTGPSLLTRISHQAHDLRPAICPRDYFHFCDYRQWRTIFSNTPLPQEAYVIHYFGKLSFEYTNGLDDDYVRKSDSLFAGVARRYVNSTW